MLKHKIHFKPNDVTIEVEEGTNLLQAAMMAGVHINASCGGGGACGKCRVILEKGELDSPRTEQISVKDYETGYRQACKSTVTGDLEILIPVESQFSSKGLEKTRPGANAAREAREAGVEDLIADGKFNPPVSKKLVKVKPPAQGDNVSDLTRIIQALKSQHNVHNLDVDFDAIRALPNAMREGDFELTAVLFVPTSFGQEDGSDRTRLIQFQPGDHTSANYGLAVDIGTTTVWLQLLDLNDGSVVAQAADLNHQLSYGEDVISRILYAGKEGGLERMQELAVDTINGLIEKVLRKSRIDRDDIAIVTVAGNTTMTQLFLAVDPRFIRLSPYVPTAAYYPPIPAPEIGLKVGGHALVNVFPAAASYVGGDIIAGILAAKVYREQELTLYIDLGTNGEIVVGNQDWMACAACSAGPAFEGGGVKFGMRATSGAIEDFAINPETLEPMIVTVDMQKPQGVCGSGLINTVAGLFEMGIINEQGKFERDLPTSRIREGEDGWEYVLSWGTENDLGRDITLTEVDIDNLMRAKAAMYAGFQTLLEGVGLDIHSLDRVIIAGGFGRYINLEKSILIGLLPELPLEKFTFIGNGSLAGARMACLSNQLRYEVRLIENKMTNFELSEVPAYMDYYVAAQFLPHTRRDFFPSVIERVSLTRQLARKS